MTKEEFVDKMLFISQESTRLLREESDLMAQFASDHREFMDGEVVEIITPASNGGGWNKPQPQKSRYAIVVGVSAKRDGYLKYDLKKIKKDGTVSQVNDRCWWDEYIQHVPNTSE